MADKISPPSETSRAITQLAQHSFERRLFGEDSFAGMARVLLMIGAFVLVFGSLFYFLQTQF